MKKALPSLKNRPILADIVQLQDGTYDFYSHDFEVNEDGTITYQEFPIGVTTDVENASLIYDEKADKTYVEVDGVIYEEYGNQAAEIIRRKGGTKVSVELSILDLSFNAKEKYMEINDFYFSGITCLGTNPKTGAAIEEGMEGARLDLKDFSEEKNSFFAEKKGGKEMEKLNVTMDEEEVALEEGTSEEITEEEISGEEEISEEEIVIEEHSEEEALTANLQIGSKTFAHEISANDKIFALSELINTVYADSDNDWYGVDVYDGYVVMSGYWSNRHYRQDYSETDGVFTLVGDREEVYVNYLTKEEEDKLAKMKEDYAALIQFKQDAEQKELNEKRDTVLSDAKYDVLAEDEAFKALVDTKADYSVEDLALHANAILGNHYAKFSEQKNSKVGLIDTNQSKSKEKKKPYGNLFD